MENHIIIYPEMYLNHNKKSVQLTANLSPRTLMISALYWDKILTPNNNFYYAAYEVVEEFRELNKAGFILMDILEINGGGYVSDIIYKENKKYVFEKLNSKKSNTTINDAYGLFSNDKENTLPDHGEIVNLINAIPEPSVSTNIHDILEFRLKRGDELKNLMIKLNEFELRIMKAENKEMEFKMIVNELDRACYDIIKLYKESKIKFNLSNVKFNFSIKEVMKFAGSAYGGAIAIGLGETTALLTAMAAGAAATLEINADISYKKIDKTCPFNYIGMMSKKLS